MRTAPFDLTYLSLGGGVQSTTLLVCAAKGLHGVPRPDVVIFADPGAEIAPTLRHLALCEAFAEAHGLKVYRRSAGNLEKQLLGEEQAKQSGFPISIPAYTLNEDGTVGMLRRQCTAHYKLDPIRLQVRELLGLKPGQHATKFKVKAMIGISLDEVQRMKPSEDKWQENVWPLIDAKLSRQGCVRVLEKDGSLPVPVKSACRFCPYHDDAYWGWLKKTEPFEFSRAVVVDHAIRNMTDDGVKRPVFLHRSCKPLEEIDFDAESKVQRYLWDSFSPECFGMCGT
jgi:hypothetical protein